MTASRKLTVADIVENRAYEHERDDFRRRVIAIKKKRRVAVGPFVTFVFENRETMRFQVQEMARAERLSTDEAIENELRAFNPLIPEPGELKATMFLELTSDALLREWIPKLANIERSVSISVGGRLVPMILDGDHEKQLTREHMTSAVHYLEVELNDELVESLAVEGATVMVDHPEYTHAAQLGADTIEELLLDLRP